MRPILLAIALVAVAIGVVEVDGLDPPTDCSADTRIEASSPSPLVADVDVAPDKIGDAMVAEAPEPFSVEPARIEAIPRAVERPPCSTTARARLANPLPTTMGAGGIVTGRFADAVIARG